MSIHYSSSQRRHQNYTPYGAGPPPPPRPVSGYGGGYADPAYGGGGPAYGAGGYGGGYGAPPVGPPGLPAGADPQLWQWFNAVDADHSGAISVKELQSALVNGLSLLIRHLSLFFQLIPMLQGIGQVRFDLVHCRVAVLSQFLLLKIEFDLDTVKLLMNIFVRACSKDVIRGRNSFSFR